MRISWMWDDVALAYREPSVRSIVLRAWFTHLLLCVYVLVLAPFVVSFFAITVVSALVMLVGRGTGLASNFCMDLVVRLGKPVHDHTRVLRSRAEQTLRDKA